MLSIGNCVWLGGRSGTYPAGPRQAGADSESTLGNTNQAAGTNLAPGTNREREREQS